MYSAAVGWSVLYMSVRSFWPIVLFKSAVSLLILGLEDLSIVGSGVLKSPHIMVLLFCSPFSSVSISFFFFNLFIYLFLAVLGLRFCARAFSNCGKRGPLFIAVRGLLTVAASLVAEHRLQTRRLSSVAHGPSCSAACGIFPDQGSNPCPLHWQADSQPLRHQGSPVSVLYI